MRQIAHDERWRTWPSGIVAILIGEDQLNGWCPWRGAAIFKHFDKFSQNGQLAKANFAAQPGDNLQERQNPALLSLQEWIEALRQ